MHSDALIIHNTRTDFLTFTVNPPPRIRSSLLVLHCLRTSILPSPLISLHYHYTVRTLLRMRKKISRTSTHLSYYPLSARLDYLLKLCPVESKWNDD